MGKKLSQVSTKITKNNNNNNDKKKQLNSLIKVLRPKVYIIDSASFKNLVQELTGNGNIPLVSSSSSSPPLPHDGHFNPPPVIEIEDDIATNFDYNSYQQSSPDFSSSELSVQANSFSTTDPSLEYYCSPEELGYYQPTTTTTTTNTFSEFGSLMENIDHFTQYRHVESWLLEMDPLVNSSYEHGYVPVNFAPEPSCMYDYDLTGMIM